MNIYIETGAHENYYPVGVSLAQNRSKARVACLGDAGSYTEAARHELLGESLERMDATFLPYNATVVQEVEKGNYDLGIVPVENATEGDVVEVLRELNHAKNITILGEEILGIQHMLIGWQKESIQEIYSHPQALAQCRTHLLNNYPSIPQKESASTSAAAEMVKTNKQIAAIASKRAAQIRGLPILEEDIGDIKGNSTRFLMIGRGETFPTGQDSTSFILIPKGDRPGILAIYLTILASRGINLTKLDSRPTGVMRQYAFWITIDGHIKDEMIKRGIDDLKETFCSSLRILGSYRKAAIPAGIKDPGTINGQ